MSKTAAVLAHLKKGKTITSWQAFEKFRATRLADIIFKLRGQGYNIGTELVEDGSTRFARYRLTHK
jgi:hypothetical protein